MVRKYADDQDTVTKADTRCTQSRSTPNWVLLSAEKHADKKVADASQHTDEKNTVLRDAVRQFADDKDVTVWSYVDEKHSVVRNARVLKDGSVVTGNLIICCKRVTGFPTGASTAETDAASVAQLLKVFTDVIKNSD